MSSWTAKEEPTLTALLSRMTLEEKIGQLVQLPPKGDFLDHELKTLIEKGHVGSFLNISDPEQIQEAQEISLRKSRLKIPLLFAFDVLHGFKTLFPIPLALASSMDPSLVEKIARGSAQEARSYGIHWTFAPMLDITRDPRWGRVAECPGEDPYLASLLCAGWIKGFQGNALSSSSLLASCPKHFVGYGAVEGGRDYNSANVSLKQLKEIYLVPFLEAFKTGSFSTMAAFVAINGLPPAANPYLLKDLLRKEIGFKGPVISDWNAVKELVHHGIAENEKEAAQIAINSGIDIDMASGLYLKYLKELVLEGKVQIDTIDQAVLRVLSLKHKLGLFSVRSPQVEPNKENLQAIIKTNREIALEAAINSVVLLKNENALLPLSPSIRTIALIGPFGTEQKEHLGPWPGIGDPQQVVSLAEGMKAHAPLGVKIAVARGCDFFTSSQEELRQALEMAKKAEVIIVAVGEKASMSGEAASRAFLELPKAQQKLIDILLQIGLPVIMVVFSGRPLDLSPFFYRVKGIIQAWFLGSETGNALGRILFGFSNPSGKLPISFPRSVGQIPIYYSHLPTGRPSGWSIPSTGYLDQKISPLFPFGYGLSYTSFHYGFPTLNHTRIGPDDVLEVYVEIENSGEKAGEEIVQLYIRDAVASISRPLKELKGVKKIFLNPGEKQKVKFSLFPSDFAFVDFEGKRKIEGGRFFLWVGPNAVEGKKVQFELAW
ncbi:glycoside hydrolase family 3 N-terminal domain-containing protein [Candidatus Methylacidiphilum infernorum]|nr:glycoside hydrolase family 3 N-terminal domain-containing protein [Candidatus Methylacidiphilum infernorum]